MWSTDRPPGGFRAADVSDTVPATVAEKPVLADYSGPGRIAGYTVLHEPGQPVRAIAVVDLADGARALATSTDPAVTSAFEGDREFVGAPLIVDGERFQLAA